MWRIGGIFDEGADAGESRAAEAVLLSAMRGEAITPDEIGDGSCCKQMVPIAVAGWVKENQVPTVVAYGACNLMQPFAASKRLEAVLAASGADCQRFVAEHSGYKPSE